MLYVVNAFAYQNIIIHEMENIVTKRTVAVVVAATAAVAFFLDSRNTHTIDGCVCSIRSK